MKSAVIGAGSWGTAIAQLLADNGSRVTLWARRPQLSEEIRRWRENRSYLPGIRISDKILVTSDLQEALCDAEFVVMAVPSQSMRSIIREVGKYIKSDSIIVSAAKGIEIGTLLRMSQVMKEELPPERRPNIAVLSGPSHAEEVARRLPTAVVVAAEKKEVAEGIQDLFMNSYFRVYTNPDIIGVEMGGALKNIIAICAGIAEGLGFGDNTRAALITRGIIEITRLGVKMGAHPATFSGLSGIGDVIVTCNSLFSRNRRAGIEIGRGKSVTEVMASTNMVIEGIHTTKAAYDLARQHGVEMPITEQAYDVLYQGKNPLDAVNALMKRKGKHEMEEVVQKEIEWIDLETW
ncbi:NAD(P)H-dependent glycerol-3-phosphate dehydrogenase [Thermosediminibacter oceani]|uniref:Glycerol-3-phosphate dehydrogenase [NAD(P)+] n=1 Tax=Thermosediminibacter oceani (strain ATCC BAA-1034 / DSM 16646 / JW/IW-1228P) TaxID=555079 RepID=D9S2W4_THEOJ|nr:NAD(P)H-dependent glycerol-3-phosphate dehydrogenase [Thermosediminibacter oceani]ADL07741.1 glycerol 3-phosphate dehydrogenase (NAD(P)+) [Thermosediminibacter oceani DSM 16646]